MSTHNIWFCGKIRKILSWYPLLSRTMDCHKRRQMMIYIYKLLNENRVLWGTKYQNAMQNQHRHTLWSRPLLYTETYSGTISILNILNNFAPYHTCPEIWTNSISAPVDASTTYWMSGKQCIWSGSILFAQTSLTLRINIVTEDYVPMIKKRAGSGSWMASWTWSSLSPDPVWTQFLTDRSHVFFHLNSKCVNSLSSLGMDFI